MDQIHLRVFVFWLDVTISSLRGVFLHCFVLSIYDLCVLR